MSRLIWRLKLVAELEPGVVSETEVARIEREDFAVPETLGLTLGGSEALTAAIQAKIVSAQVAVMGQQFRWREHCGPKLLSKGYYPTTFRSLFGDVLLLVRRLSACPCRAEMLGAQSFAAWVPMGGIAPELAYITAKYGALAPFARVADLLSELLPTGGTANAGTVRNRTLRVGSAAAQLTPVSGEMLEPGAVTAEVIVGLDGGYVRSRHPRPERNFEVVAGKVVGSDGIQRRFAFARNGASAQQFARALVRAGVRGRKPATVLSDGDTGLRNLQRRVLPKAAVVLDWFHIATRFQHALQTAVGLGTGTVPAYTGMVACRDIEHAKWRLWRGRWQGCLIKLARLSRWTEAKSIRHIEGVRALRRHLHHLIAYLEANRTALVNYRARRAAGKPISTAFVESAIDEIVARRMIKKEQMRWNS